MKKKITRYTAHVIVLFCIITIVSFFIASCVMQAQRMPQTLTKYNFGGYRVPETRPPASVKFTVGVVEPAYKEQMNNVYSKVLKSFSSRVGSGLDEILVAKGMTTKGPYGSLDEIPYPDKKGSNLILTETVFIQTSESEGQARYENYDDEHGGRSTPYSVRDGKLTVEVWLTYEMREPLSGEKMWIKKLDLGTIEKPYKVGVQMHLQQTREGDPWSGQQWVAGDAGFNTRPDAFAEALGEVYPQIMDRAWVYLNSEELMDMTGKIDEIRERLSAPLTK